MRSTRNYVFETNSSSTHSISFTSRDNYLEENRIAIDGDGYMHVKFGEFGWEVCTYTDQYNKLSYLLTMALELNGNAVWLSNNVDTAIEWFMTTEDFKLISDEIAQYTGCKGIIIDHSDGYIDHQSVYGGSIRGFLDENGTGILDFVYGNVIVHTDNDNHY